MMKIPYNKYYTCPRDLVILLKNRGLTIDDEAKTVDSLVNIGYYRLSAYCFPLLKTPKSDHVYKTNASFELIMKMYQFDRELRLLIFDEIEKIEVAVRSAMSNMITEGLNNVFWMTDATNFYNQTIYTKTVELIESEIDKTKEEFVAHFQSKYIEPHPPAWMIVEVISFGLLCGIYNNMKSAKLKKKVAKHFGLSSRAFSSWMITLVNLRNLCCHHGRVWNREIPVVPADLQQPAFPWIDSSTTDMKRIYFRICIIKYLLFTVSPSNAFTEKLTALLDEFPTIDIRAMGFPANWRSEPLWIQNNNAQTQPPPQIENKNTICNFFRNLLKKTI